MKGIILQGLKCLGLLVASKCAQYKGNLNAQRNTMDFMVANERRMVFQ